MGYEYEYLKGLRPQVPVAKPREHDPRNRRPSVSFQSNIPERVALAHPDGVYKDGMYGPRVMYTLIDGRVMFLDPDVAARIKTMGMLPAQEFWIVKRKPAGRGQKTRWDIYLEDPTPLAGESPLECDLRLSLHEIARQRAIPQEQSEPLQPPGSESGPRPVCTPPSPGIQEVALTVMRKKQPAWEIGTGRFRTAAQSGSARPRGTAKSRLGERGLSGDLARISNIERDLNSADQTRYEGVILPHVMEVLERLL